MSDPALNIWTGQPYAQRLDPELARLLERQSAGVAKADRYAVPFPESRRLLEEERKRTHVNCIPMHRVEDAQITVHGRQVRLRWYHASPESLGRTPIVYLHGGGWCVGSNVTHDTVLRHLARAAQAPVCGVEYSLAPEHPFPAAFEDVGAAVDFVRGQPARPGVQANDQVILAGDSAGANLALVEAMRRRDEGRISDIAALLLYYGSYAPCRDEGSFAVYGDGRFGLSRRAQERYFEAYLQTASRRDWRAFPILGELRGLPPTYVLAAELDPLYDDSIDLYRALLASQVASRLSIASAMPHGFLNQANDLPAAAREIDLSVAYLEEAAAREGGR